MQFEEPKIKYIQYNEDDVVIASNKCTDSWTGGTLVCTGANMEGYCGEKMESLR